MSGMRESVFECTYASAALLRTAHVRAWDAQEAVELFAHELLDDGVEEDGEISVRVPGASPTETSAFHGPR